MSTYYEPLTPELRRKALDSIEHKIKELNTCQSTCFTSMYMAGYKAAQSIIKGLPDGYPMPIERRGH